MLFLPVLDASPTICHLSQSSFLRFVSLLENAKLMKDQQARITELEAQVASRGPLETALAEARDQAATAQVRCCTYAVFP